MEQLASGRFRARYSGPDGRWRSAPATFATRTEADRWLATVQADMARGQWIDPAAAAVALGTYTTDFLRTRAPHLRPRTRDLYARLARRWILAPVGTGRHRIDLGALELGQITPALVREWYAAVAAQAQHSATTRATGSRARVHPARTWATSQGITLAPTGRIPAAVLDAWQAAGRPQPPGPAPDPQAGRASAAQAYRLLRTILGQATDDGLLLANPARIPGAGTITHPERVPLTPTEVDALAQAVPEHYRAAVLLAAYSGLRPGEVFALRRTDLDLADGAVHVRQTLVEVPGQPLAFGPPKTAAGHRTVALPRFVTEALTEHVMAHTTPGPTALVFTTHTGTPVTGSARSTIMRTARTKIDRPDITWHHLRHTGATLAAITGATTAELQARIGHTSPRAAHLYQHATTTRDRTIATHLHTLATTNP